MPRYVVQDGVQVNVAGTVYGPGESFDATAEDVAEALAAGWAAPAPPKPKKGPRLS